MILWILRLSAAYAVALNGTMVMPVVVLSLSKLAGYDEATATIVASAELAGIALYGLLLPKLAFGSWRMVAFGGAVAVVVGEAASFWLHAPLPLAAARLATGIGEGAIFSLVSISLASLANAERYWGALSLIGGTTMGVLLFAVSLMPQAEGEAPVFLVLAAYAALMAPLLLFISRRAPAIPVAAGHSTLDRVKMALMLTVVLLVYAVQAGQWAVCGYVGEAVGLSSGAVGFYLAVSSIAGFVGAVVPAFTRDRARRLPAVLAGFLVMAVSIHFLFNWLTPAVFVAAQVLVNMGFYILTPFVTGILTENDPDGTLMSRTLIVAIVGAAVGTAVAGPIFADAGPAIFAWSFLLPLAIAAVCATVVFGRLHRGRADTLGVEYAE